MNDLVLDFETYYDSDYTLKKMENAEYVMDPRFEIIGVSTQVPGQKPRWITGTLQEIRDELAKIEWKDTRVIAHNARFDGSILEWRLGFKPRAYLCTMVGSRPHLVPYAGGASLNQLARYLQIGVKGDYVLDMGGKHRSDLEQHQLDEYGIYCSNDVDLCGKIAEHLSTILPADEQEVIDLTLKKYIRPVLLLDEHVLSERLAIMVKEKEDKLAYLKATYDIGLEELRSRNTFADILGAELAKGGESVPVKFNSTGDTTFAFAKDDLGMKDLLIHSNQKVRELAQAKLDFSSTLEQARIGRLLMLHKIMDGKLPVPLVYYGAHTGRFSGDGKINLQNLPRVTYDKAGVLKKGQLRFALRAQPGYSIVAADLSNIEARIVATLSGQLDLVAGFAAGSDIYSQFASKIYGKVVSKDTHPLERFVGKTCILGLGYGMGPKKFHLKMLQEGIDMDSKAAMNIVYLYRHTYDRIPRLWTEIEHLAGKHMTNRSAICPWRNGITIAHERIILPNGMPILYPGLCHTTRGLGFRSRYGKSLMDGGDPDVTNSVWGGAFTENLAQALAKIILTRAELKLARAGLPAVLQVHDELVYHVPTAIVPQVKAAIEKVMTEVVDFMPNLPVAVEINDGPTYGDAK